jgi:hypothetical protein
MRRGKKGLTGETWFPPCWVKETFIPPTDYRYPFMDSDGGPGGPGGSR